MKKLQKVTGPRNCSLIEVTIHIANLTFQYREDRKIFEDKKLSHDVKAQAYQRMCRSLELLHNWKEVRKDILKKSGIKEVV